MDFKFQKEVAKPPHQIKERAQYFLTRRNSKGMPATEQPAPERAPKLPSTGHMPTYLHKRFLVRLGTIENLNVQGQSSASHGAGREDWIHREEPVFLWSFSGCLHTSHWLPGWPTLYFPLFGLISFLAEVIIPVSCIEPHEHGSWQKHIAY